MEVTLNVFNVITIFCWAIWGILDKKAVSISKPADVCIILSILGILKIPFFAVILNAMHNHINLATDAVIYAFLSSIISTVALVTYVIAMSKADASFVVATSSAYPLVTVILSIVFLHEHIAAMQFVGVSVLVMGVIITSGGTINFSKAKANNRQSLELAVLMLIGVLASGLRGVVAKAGVEASGPIEYCLITSCWDVFAGLLIYAFYKYRGHQFSLRSPKTIGLCTASTLVLALSTFTCFAAMEISTASYVISITACYPLLMYFFALLFLREKFSLFRFSGIALITVGAVFIQTSSLDHERTPVAHKATAPINHPSV